MYQITRLSEARGLSLAGESDRIKEILSAYGLPVQSGLSISDLTDAIKLDKKNLNNHLNVVLLHKIGDSYVQPIDLDFFKKAGMV